MAIAHKPNEQVSGKCILKNRFYPNKSPKSLFDSTEQGVRYKKLLGEIEKAKERFKDDNFRIELESTGVYPIGITDFLKKKFPESVILINPVLISLLEFSIHFHYAKADKNNALGICKFLSMNKDIRAYAIYHATTM